MNGYSRIRRQRLIQEAEGYLDLILVAGGPLPTTPANRTRLAERTIRVLDQLESCESNRELHRSRAHYLRGQALRLMEQYPTAIAAFRQSLSLEPQNFHTLLSIAWCYKRIGHVDLAIETLEEALTFAPQRAILHYNLACYWSLANHLDPALAHLSRAFELNAKYRTTVHSEPDFDNIRHCPEFLAMATARLPNEC